MFRAAATLAVVAAARGGRGIAVLARGAAARARLAPAAFRPPSLAGAAPARSLFIKIDTTPNPDSLKFVPDGRVVLPEELGSGMHFASVAEAKSSKLVRKLLKINEITGVFLGRDFISVNKMEDASWTPLKPIVLNAIMDAFGELDAKGTPLVEEGRPRSPDTVIQPEDSEVVAMVKELLETRIRPAVQEDGGDIYFVSWDEATGTVKLRMAGSCVGCPSSTATLRNGVENMLKHYIPEVLNVEQVKGELEEVGQKELNSLEERLKAAGAE